jgi:hypothetical protein
MILPSYKSSLGLTIPHLLIQRFYLFLGSAPPINFGALIRHGGFVFPIIFRLLFSVLQLQYMSAPNCPSFRC